MYIIHQGNHARKKGEKMFTLILYSTVKVSGESEKAKETHERAHVEARAGEAPGFDEVMGLAPIGENKSSRLHVWGNYTVT